MTNTIGSTGTISTQNGRTVVSGSSSGIDTSALIEAAIKQRTREADKLDAQIKKNDLRIAGYQTLADLGAEVRAKMQNLRQVYGSTSTSNSIFNRKAGALSVITGSGNAGNILGVTLSDSAQVGTTEIVVLKKAMAAKVAGGTVTDKTADLGYTGTFSIGLDGATAANINVTADMSLQEIATAINAQSSGTKVTASVLKVGENAFQLVLTGTNTAKNIQISDTAGTVMQDLGVINGGGAFVDVIQPPQQAEIQVDGILVTRDSNLITDILDGVTLNIKAADTGTTIALEVTKDTTASADAILDFVEAYNTFRQFVKDNQAVGADGSVATGAILFGDTLLKTLNQEIQGLLSRSYNTGDPALTTMRDLGITLEDDNFLDVDEEILNNVLSNKFDTVRAMFETQHSSSSPDFRLLNNTAVGDFGALSIDITASGPGAISAVTVNGEANMFDISGTSIIGKKGTRYEGLSFAYIGAGSTTLTMTINQGLGDLVSNNFNRYTDSTTGELTAQINRINSDSDTLQTRAERVRERAEQFRESLIAKYSRMEALINSANSTLAQIRAILGTNKDD
ncbi:MAG: flagellar filament capping protein FliD [Pseudomonadota bacterium]